MEGRGPLSTEGYGVCVCAVYTIPELTGDHGRQIYGSNLRYNGLERLLKAVLSVLQIMCLFTFKLKIKFLSHTSQT